MQRHKLQRKIIQLLKAAHRELQRENYPVSFLHLFTARRYAQKMEKEHLFLSEERHIPVMIEEQLRFLVEAKLWQN